VSKVNTIMKQPELGKKITELRNAKGLTQEDLVEKCNLSVRTIQRIEAGEVTPRSYTVKMIMEALDYDISIIADDDEGFIESLINGLKKFLLLEVDLSKSSDFLIRQLNLAWIFGILYFMIGFLEAAAEYYRAEENLMIAGNFVYVTIKIAVLITYIFFQRGFVLIGGLFQNYLLKIVSFILIFGNVIVIGYDIVSIFYEAVEREFIIGAEALTFGGIGIIYGISLYRLNKSLGDAARYAGIFEFIAAGFFLTVVLGFVGLIILIPAELLEIIVLYKAVEIIRSKSKTQTQTDS